MKKDAEAHAGEDKKRREMVDMRNQAEAVTLQVEKELQEHGGKVGPQERGDIETSLNRVKELMKGEDGESLNQPWARGWVRDQVACVKTVWDVGTHRRPALPATA
jgi:molecular chaperone DnaK (HSP70)